MLKGVTETKLKEPTYLPKAAILKLSKKKEEDVEEKC